MESSLRIGCSIVLPVCSSPKLNQLDSNTMFCGFRLGGSGSSARICAITPNGSVSASVSASHGAESSSVRGMHKRISSLESLFCYDKPVPEEIIEKPVGLALAEKEIGDNPQCTDCLAKGAVLCATCAGSGLYVDSIMESQGIIVKIRCLGCGGTGNIMCSECGGRGHLGPK